MNCIAFSSVLLWCGPPISLMLKVSRGEAAAHYLVLVTRKEGDDREWRSVRSRPLSELRRGRRLTDYGKAATTLVFLR
ncbi:MAG: hypothetical protein LZF60_80261 [Nitrospira sp.]|nr:MAG: hypothetical protein LZF60_80261 [Nitrospira sp.]